MSKTVTVKCIGETLNFTSARVNIEDGTLIVTKEKAPYTRTYFAAGRWIKVTEEGIHAK